MPRFNGIDRLARQPAASRQRLLTQASRLSLTPHVIIKQCRPLLSSHLITSFWREVYFINPSPVHYCKLQKPLRQFLLTN
jgi:hypothetical protein